MRRLLFVLAFAGCVRATPPTVVVHDTVTVRDSSCLTTLRTQRILFGLAEQQMNRYAGIVARDPSQSKFLVGWTRRAFSGVQ